MKQYSLLHGPSDKCHSWALQRGAEMPLAQTGWQECALVAFGQRHHMCHIIRASQHQNRQ